MGNYCPTCGSEPVPSCGMEYKRPYVRTYMCYYGHTWDEDMEKEVTPEQIEKMNKVAEHYRREELRKMIPSVEALALEYSKLMLQGGEYDKISTTVTESFQALAKAGVEFPKNPEEFADLVEEKVAEAFCEAAIKLAETMVKTLQERLDIQHSGPTTNEVVVKTSD